MKIRKVFGAIIRIIMFCQRNEVTTTVDKIGKYIIGF